MNLKEKVKLKLLESLNEDVYKVEHEGHPDADKVKELSHLKPGKKYVNHITKYEKSAKDAAARLKKSGFQGVKIYKNWSVMENVVLEEVELEEAKKDEYIVYHSKNTWNTGSTLVKVSPERLKKLGPEKAFTPHLPVGHKYESHELNEAAIFEAHEKGPFSETDWSNTVVKDGKRTFESIELEEGWNVGKYKKDSNIHVSSSANPVSSDPKYYEGVTKFKNKKDAINHAIGLAAKHNVSAYHNRSGGNASSWDALAHGKKVMAEEVLDESRMSELHATIGHYMDKHIDEYKRVGGAEHLMAKADAVKHKIARIHGMASGDAHKFISSYIDTKLNEK